MWRLKCFGQCQARTVPKLTPDNQVFEDRIFLIHGRDKLPLNRHQDVTVKADAMDAIALLQSKEHSLLVFCGDAVEVIDDEWKGRRMCEHVCNGRAICTDKIKTQVRCRSKYDVSPSLANVGKLIPPLSVDPFPAPSDETGRVILVFAQKKRLIKIKYMKK